MSRHITAVVACLLMVLGFHPVVPAQTWDSGKILAKFDPALDAIVDPAATIQRAPGVFGTLDGARTEGPVWTRDGALLFSETLGNVIYRLEADDTSSVWRKHAGYAKDDAPTGHVPGWTGGGSGHPGSNGLTLDPQGRVVVCEMGNRRVTRIEKDGTVTVLADNFEGKRLGPPNDIVARSDGSIYFTDSGGPKDEIPHSSLFRIAPDGKLQLLLEGYGSGLAFSPDEKFLYLASSRKWMRYEVKPDGTLGAGTVFFDVPSTEKGEGSMSGVKVDVAGNMFANGPSGTWIISPQGKALGRIQTPLTPMNIAWGGKDGKTLYMTAWTSIYRIRVKTGGKLP